MEKDNKNMQVRNQIAVLLMLCLPLPLLAQTQPATSSAAESALKKPTDFRSRAEIRNEYQDLEGDGYRNLVIPRVEYAVTPRSRSGSTCRT